MSTTVVAIVFALLCLSLVSPPAFAQDEPQATASPLHLPAPQPTKPKTIKWTDIGEGISFYDYFAQDPFGAVLQLGEFRNANHHAVRTPALEFTLLDKDGNIVTSTNPATMSPIIEAGKTTPFQIVVDNVHLGDWTSETFQAFNVDNAAASCTANLQLKNVKQTQKASDWLEIAGSVHNGGDDPVDNISIAVAVYRTDGLYAGEFSAYVQASVPPGKSARFDASGDRGSFPGVDVKPVSEDFTYRIFVNYIPGGVGIPQC